MWPYDERGARAPSHDRGRDAPEPDAREPGAPMGGESDQRRFEITDQAPDGDLWRRATNHPRFDLDLGPELLDGRADDAARPRRGLDIERVEDVHEHHPGLECKRPLAGNRHDGTRLD